MFLGPGTVLAATLLLRLLSVIQPVQSESTRTVSEVELSGYFLCDLKNWKLENSIMFLSLRLGWEFPGSPATTQTDIN